MPVRSFGSVSWVDKEVKSSTLEYATTQANAIAYVTDPTTGTTADINAAAAALSLLTVTKTAGGVRDVAASPVVPTDDQAYRSSKLTVFFHDTVTGDKEHVSIPGRNPANYNTDPRSKNVNLGAPPAGTTQVQAFVAAFNTGAVSSKLGNTILIDAIVISGRKQG
jgi:hypothetical protein